MLEIPRCDHCEEEFAPEELMVLAPPAGDGELVCARCIEIKLRRAIANLPRGDN
jgi:formylmethanofuran dehydrogenase subunit E